MKSPRTSSIVQLIFSFGLFSISEYILGNQKFMIGLDPISKGNLNVWPQFGSKPVFESTVLLKFAKLQLSFNLK